MRGAYDQTWKCNKCGRRFTSDGYLVSDGGFRSVDVVVLANRRVDAVVCGKHCFSQHVARVPGCLTLTKVKNIGFLETLNYNGDVDEDEEDLSYSCEGLTQANRPCKEPGAYLLEWHPTERMVGTS